MTVNVSFTDSYDPSYLLANMMGPNAMRITEELAEKLDIRPGQRVLDLGCGCGLSSILLAEKFGARVFAADLWIDPTDNYARFAALGLDEQIIPLRADATAGLPFADGYFDWIISVDAYQYFGINDTMLPALLRVLKPGGGIAVAMPGLREDTGGAIPEWLQPFWAEAGGGDQLEFRSPGWWQGLWSGCEGVNNLCCGELTCFERAWREWLACDNPHAKGDIAMMDAGGWTHFNLVALTAQKR